MNIILLMNFCYLVTLDNLSRFIMARNLLSYFYLSKYVMFYVWMVRFEELFVFDF